MRESSIFEVRLARFDVWRAALVGIALGGVAAAAAWGFSTARSRADESVAAIVLVALALAIASVALVLPLARVPKGVLACTSGVWTFAADAAPGRSGTLTVALDWGSFLLLRLDCGARARVWLPLQRRGLEREWHALRCAVYAPPRTAAAPPTTPAVARE